MQTLHSPLVAALQELQDKGSTGRLQVRPQQGGYGTIYVSSGRVVHAAHGLVTGLQALKAILSWNSRDYSFRPNITAKETSLDQLFSELLPEVSEAQALTPQASERPAQPAAGPTLAPGLLSEIVNVMVEFKGPIADIIVEDASLDLGYDPAELPRALLRPLFRKLLGEVPDAQRERLKTLLLALEQRYPA